MFDIGFRYLAHNVTSYPQVQAGIPGMSQDDHSLSRAIEASLTHDPTKESFEELPIDERVRKDGR